MGTKRSKIYDRNDTEWLRRYYSGDRVEDIAAMLCRHKQVPRNRLRELKLPMRPNGQFSPRRRAEWLARPDVTALRNKFAGLPRVSAPSVSP